MKNNHKKKISRGLKEYFHNNEEARENLREFRLGKSFDEMYGKEKAREIKNKIRDSHKGKKLKPFTEEHKRKIKENHADFSKENHPQWGTKMSEETKSKISIANKGKLIGENNPMRRDYVKEKIRGERNPSKRLEVRKKISLSKIGDKNPAKRKEVIDKIKRTKSNPKWKETIGKRAIEKFMKKRRNWSTPKKDTTIEVKIQNFLKQLGIDFFTHQYMKIEHGYQCDILIPSMNLIIECDGDYWHKYPIGRNIDNIRTSELLERGFKVLRLWEFEIKPMTIKQFEEKLERR